MLSSSALPWGPLLHPRPAPGGVLGRSPALLLVPGAGRGRRQLHSAPLFSSISTKEPAGLSRFNEGLKSLWCCYLVRRGGLCLLTPVTGLGSGTLSRLGELTARALPNPGDFPGQDERES